MLGRVQFLCLSASSVPVGMPSKVQPALEENEAKSPPLQTKQQDHRRLKKASSSKQLLTKVRRGCSVAEEEARMYVDVEPLREFLTSGDVALVKASYLLELKRTGEKFPRR